ncbi:MAG TPA: RHS repeat-associated core domain-containing protein [Thermoanaerobaculia bacterium]|nr:RHS repeat-associated core domain-containing protein [Thermoanaerobaculia bacterium]
MPMLRRAVLLLLASLLQVQAALGYHTPPWDTGHNPVDSQPGVEQTTPGQCRPNGQGSPVEVSTGNFIHAVPLLAMTGIGPDVNLTLVYNSLDLRKGPFGTGWTHRYEERLVVTTDGSQVFAICCQGRGKRDRLVRGGDGRRYTALPPNAIDLTRNDDETHTMRDEHGNVKEFDADGKMVRLVDRNGNALTLGYDNSGFLTTLTDAAGRVTRFAKGASGRVASVTDPANRVFSYSYDPAGHLTKITDPMGQAWSFDYDTRGLLSEIVDPRNNEQVTIEYDSKRRVSELTERAERWTFTYGNRETTKRDSDGDEWVFQYNAAGSITKRTDPQDKSIAFTYDADLNMTSVTDENGKKTNYTYDSQHNLLSMTDALGNVYRMAYEATFNLPTSIIDPLGNPTQFRYDAKGNLIRLTDPSGAVTRFEYDAKGQMTRATDAAAAVTSFAYDAHGNMVSFTAPGKAAEAATFDVIGNLLTATDGRGSVSRFVYDNARRVTSSTNPANGVTARQYDATGNLTSLTLPNGAIYKFEYDAFSRMTRIVNPLNQSSSYTYDRHDNVTSATDATGRAINFDYDPLDRPTQKRTSEETVRYTYDPAGNLLSATNSHSDVTFTVDALNRVLTTAATPQNVTITYTYDKAGRIASINDGSGGTITYGYDSRSLVTSIADFDGFTANFIYDEVGRRTRMDRTGGYSAAYEYDPASHLLSLTHSGPAGRMKFTYTHDQADNRITMTGPGGAHKYSYDHRNYLIGATHPAAAKPDESYIYDPLGNRVSSHLSATYTHDAANRLTADVRFDYTYDADGNLVQRKERSNGEVRAYTYDTENRLTRITFPDGSTATYRYDPFGRRYEKVVGTQSTRYVYLGASVLKELDGSGATIARYTPGLEWDEMMAVRRGGSTSVFEVDGLGSIIRAVSGSMMKASYVYDSFGRIVAQTGTPSASYAFQGRELDTESGLYYYRARYYDSLTGRFLSQDPIGLVGGLNLYTFVNNNPVNYVDPSGTDWADTAVNISAGIGDAFLLGFGDELRGWADRTFGSNLSDSVDRCSDAYRNASIAATSAMTLAGGGRLAYAAGAKLISWTARTAEQAVNARNTLKIVFRGGFFRDARIYPPEQIIAKYGPQGAIEAAGRTNRALNVGGAAALAGAINDFFNLPECGCEH